MEEEHFNKIQSKLKNYKYSTLNYYGYGDVKDYEVTLENDNIILIYGFNTQAKIHEYHWAANKVEDLINSLQGKKDFLISAIPHEWVPEFEKEGFVIRNAWKDFFLNNLEDIEPCDDFEFLSLDEAEEASKITMKCKNQSRGFTGQTTEWIEEWVKGTEPSAAGCDTRNTNVLIERNNEHKIAGILCVGTYPNINTKGEILWIRELAVDPAFQNKGIGRKLIMKALSYGKKHNAVKSYLAADEENVGAIHLYESVGFVPSKGQSEIDMIRL